jgi:hypothetical protein
MHRLLAVLLVVSVSSLAAMSDASASGEPSAGAKGMPGAKGTFEFKPADYMEGKETWWVDSEGVDPGKAGCHIGTDSKGVPNGRLFGEACTPEGLLVETNPGSNELHSHKATSGTPTCSIATTGASARALPRAPARWCPRHPAPSPPCARACDRRANATPPERPPHRSQ